MTLPLILASDPETPMSDLLHPFDRYDLALGLEDRGIAYDWHTLLEMRTCGELIRQTFQVVEHYAAKVNRRKLGQAVVLKMAARNNA